KLRNRTKYANRKGADLFLSIHANASNKKSLQGVETFFLSPARSKRSKNVAALENQSDIQEMNYFSKQTFLNVFNREKIISANKLALDVQQGMLNRLKAKYGGIRDGGVREAPFWVLVGAQMPAILIETGYISNKTERKRIFNSHYQDLMSKGIADGIDSYFTKSEY
ncbi:MAG TPA: N-acetylmuramoyl-L-alanine amidase, partial [Sulfurospirillum arcachonense]|nr:N-acetylmuramoyl-L-alanine amidase [Sulfurospirillum arcachonense]